MSEDTREKEKYSKAVNQTYLLCGLHKRLSGHISSSTLSHCCLEKRRKVRKKATRAVRTRERRTIRAGHGGVPNGANAHAQ